MKAITQVVLFRVLFVVLAVYTFFGGRCPAQGCPACRMVGK